MKWAFSADLARHRGWEPCEKILLTLNLPETHLLLGCAGHVLPTRGPGLTLQHPSCFLLCTLREGQGLSSTVSRRKGEEFDSYLQ